MLTTNSAQSFAFYLDAATYFKGKAHLKKLFILFYKCHVDLVKLVDIYCRSLLFGQRRKLALYAAHIYISCNILNLLILLRH